MRSAEKIAKVAVLKACGESGSRKRGYRVSSVSTGMLAEGEGGAFCVQEGMWEVQRVSVDGGDISEGGGSAGGGVRTITLVTSAEGAMESRNMVCSYCRRGVDVRLDGIFLCEAGFHQSLFPVWAR